MPDIFISYRREDTSGYAGRLYDQVSAHFGKDHVFMDVADLEPGSDFVDTIEKKVGTCDALIALIGKNWLTMKDDQGHVRLSRPGDFVSVEVAAALRRNIEVVPVLVGGAKMPLQEALPEALQLLSRRQAIEISDVNFIRDVGDLVEALKRPPGSRTVPARNWYVLAAAIVAIFAAAAAFGIWTWQNRPHPREPAEGPVGVRKSAPPPESAVPGKSSPILNSPTLNKGISGNWLAVVQKGDVKFETFFTFEVVGDKLFGRVVYPTGEAGILNGTIRQNRISFTTKHVPNFADEEATTTVEGQVSGEEIQVFIQNNDGYSKGAAHRVTRIGQPKVLTP